jgi:hypothetical protein
MVTPKNDLWQRELISILRFEIPFSKDGNANSGVVIKDSILYVSEN